MLKKKFYTLLLLSINNNCDCIEVKIARPRFKALEEVYDFWAPNYKELVEITQYKIIDWIDSKKSFLPDTDKLALDLGCADGMVGEFIYTHNKNYKFIGVDFSKKMVEACAKNYVYSDVIQADLSNGLPKNVCNKSYDIVFATGCLEFIQNHDELFDQIQKILKPEGLFWLTLQLDTGNVDRIALDKILNLYTPEKAYDILKRHNFNILDFEVNHCIYKNSRTQEPTSYCMIIAQNK